MSALRLLLQGTPALCTLNHDRTFHADAFEVCSSLKSYVFKGSTSEAVTKCQPISEYKCKPSSFVANGEIKQPLSDQLPPLFMTVRIAAWPSLPRSCRRKRTYMALVVGVIRVTKSITKPLKVR